VESAGAAFKLLVFLGSAAGLAWGAYHFWETSPALRVRQILVEGPALPGWAENPPLKPGAPLFGFSSRAIEKRLRERYPRLGDVSVRRGWDRSVRIHLSPRVPEARLFLSEQWWGVDGSAHLFPLPDEGAGLPILVLPTEKPDPAGALAFLAALRAAKEPWTESLYKIKISPDGEATLLLAGELPVFWGEALPEPDRVAAKARRLGRVLSAPEALDGLEYARFVDDRRVAIKPLEKKETHGKTGTHHGT
jgi:cell division septal protein FtsQ